MTFCPVTIATTNNNNGLKCSSAKENDTIKALIYRSNLQGTPGLIYCYYCEVIFCVYKG